MSDCKKYKYLGKTLLTVKGMHIPANKKNINTISSSVTSEHGGNYTIRSYKVRVVYFSLVYSKL